MKLEDIFYVGMSHAGVIARLYQFIRGIENGKHHSGAMRFFKTYASEVPFSKLPTKKTFFVTATAIECVTDKKLRTAEDLRKMGEVARLEFYVLAHIKEMCNKEPELNKK